MEKTDQIRKVLLNAYRVLLHSATLRGVELSRVFIGYYLEGDYFIVVINQREHHKVEAEVLLDCIHNFLNLKYTFVWRGTPSSWSVKNFAYNIEGFDAAGFTHVTLRLNDSHQSFHLDPKIYKYQSHSD